MSEWRTYYSFAQMQMSYFGGGLIACGGVAIERGFLWVGVALALVGIGLHGGAVLRPAAPEHIGR